MDTIPTLGMVAPDSDAARGQTYNGRSGQLSVRIPRMDAEVPLDGTLNAPIWERAAVLTGFSEYTPVDGLPAEDSTEVLVWYSAHAICFGVRAFEPYALHFTDLHRQADNFFVKFSYLLPIQ